MSKKIFVGIALVASFNIVPIFVFADHNTTHTIQQLTEQVNALLVRIQALQSQTIITTPSPTPLPGTPFCHTFNAGLRTGDTGAEVTALQEALRKEVNSAVGISAVFDNNTATAVSAFQEKYKSEILTPNGLSSGTGFVGISTRAKLNQLFRCGQTQTTQTMTTTNTTIQYPTSIVVLSPNGGETLALNGRNTITWTATSNIQKVDISLYKNGDYVGMIATSAPNSGSYTWTPSNLISSSNVGNNMFKIFILGTKIGGANVEDLSNSSFSIVAPTLSTTTTPTLETTTPSISMTSPADNTQITAGTSVTVQWTASNMPSNAKFSISLIKITTAAETVLARDISSSERSRSVTVPSTLSIGSYYLSVSSSCDANACPFSSEKTVSVTAPTSTITPDTTPTLSMTSPADNTQITAGTSVTVQWTASNMPSNATFVISLINTSTAAENNLAISIPNTERSRSVTIPPSQPAGNYYISVACGNGSCLVSGQKTVFVVAPATQTTTSVVSVLSPNGGESLISGQTQRVSWTSSGVNSVRLYIFDSSISGSGSTNYLTNVTISASQGYYDWTIPPVEQLPGGKGGNNFKIRIDNADNASVTDSSNATFSIVAPTLSTTTTPTLETTTPSISMTSPADNTQITAGTSVTVQWTASNMPSNATFVISLINTSTAAENNLAISIPNTERSRSVTIPPSQPAGNYYISVACGNGSCLVSGQKTVSVTVPTVLVVAGYRYVQVKSTSNSWVAWHEIQVYDSTGNMLTPASCSESGNYNSSCNQVYPGIEGYWNAGNYSGYVTLDFGSNKNITQVKLLPSNWPNPANATHEILVKPDGSNTYTNFKTFSGQIYDQQWLTYSAPTSQSASPKFASVIYAMMETLRSISKQLDLLK